MTIKQKADELGVSPQAVYQRLKKNGIAVYKLSDPKTKELTADGEIVISKLFSQPNEDFKPTKQAIVDELNQQLSKLREDNAGLIEKVAAQAEEIRQLKADKESLTKALDKAQDLHQQTLNRLLPAAGQTVQNDRLTWRERLTGRKRS